MHAGCLWSTQAGEWKLAGFELLTELSADWTAAFQAAPRDVFDRAYLPPEVNEGWRGTVVLELASQSCIMTLAVCVASGLRGVPAWFQDTWGVACLIQRLFRGSVPTSVAALKDTSALPVQLRRTYLAMIVKDPTKCATPHTRVLSWHWTHVCGATYCQTHKPSRCH